MEIDSYWTSFFDQNMPNTRFLLAVKRGVNPQEVVPSSTLSELGNLEKHISIDIQPGDKRIALNSEEAINEIESKGYYVSNVTMNISVSTSI